MKPVGQTFKEDVGLSCLSPQQQFQLFSANTTQLGNYLLRTGESYSPTYCKTISVHVWQFPTTCHLLTKMQDSTLHRIIVSISRKVEKIYVKKKCLADVKTLAWSPACRIAARETWTAPEDICTLRMCKTFLTQEEIILAHTGMCYLFYPETEKTHEIHVTSS